MPGISIMGLYAHIYATYDVNGINNATRSTVYIFDIYNQTNITATFQIYLTQPTNYMGI